MYCVVHGDLNPAWTTCPFCIRERRTSGDRRPTPPPRRRIHAWLIEVIEQPATPVRVWPLSGDEVRVSTDGYEVAIEGAGLHGVGEVRRAWMDSRVWERARVYRAATAFVWEDLSRGYGPTLINGDRCAGPHTLRDGDEIDVGPCRLAFFSRRQAWTRR